MTPRGPFVYERWCVRHSRANHASLTRGSRSEPSREAARDEFVVGVVAHHEGVVADDLEAVARIEPLRPVVFAPHADPDRAWAAALEPVQRGAQQRGPAAPALVSLQDVEALNLAVAGCDVGVGQVRRACGHVADGGL